MPIFTLLVLTRRVEAQLESSREEWAVVEFSAPSRGADKKLGRAAMKAVNLELGKLNRYSMILEETIDRKVGELGYTNPVSNKDQIVRLGQSLPATAVVSGDIVDWRILAVPGGKQAQVKMRVSVRDVASGIVVNGAALIAESAAMTGAADEETLLSNAIADGAFKAVGEINANTLPKATVLNTTDNQALINQGARSGFRSGQQLIVTRGREQVAVAKVNEVEPDSAFVSIVSQKKGIQPGDRVQAVFTPNDFAKGWPKGADSGFVKTKSARKGGIDSGVVSLLIVLGLAVLLFGKGNSSNNNVLQNFSAKLLPPANDSRLAIQLNWRPDAFVKEPYRLQYQIWRNDVGGTPVLIVPGSASSAVDDGISNAAGAYYDFTGVNSSVCSGLTGGGTSTPTLLSSGVPYIYSIELIWKRSALDNPDTGATGGDSGGATAGGTAGTGGLSSGGSTGTTGSSGGSGGINSGGSTGTTGGNTGTTSGSTGSTSTDGFCYGTTPRQYMKSSITPFAQPTLNSPDDNSTLNNATAFRWSSMRRPGSNMVIEYVLQFSPNPGFPAGSTLDVTKVVDTSSTGFIATPSLTAVLTAFPGNSTLYWRVGVRNNDEAVTNFVYSGIRKFSRPTNPPGL